MGTRGPTAARVLTGTAIPFFANLLNNLLLVSEYMSLGKLTQASGQARRLLAVGTRGSSDKP